MFNCDGMFKNAITNAPEIVFSIYKPIKTIVNYTHFEEETP